MVVDRNDNEEKGEVEETEKSPGRGLYDLKYETLDSIGKGAFGFVKTGERKTDGKEVRTVSRSFFPHVNSTKCMIWS